jgi:predicted dienelactone hydrolase
MTREYDPFIRGAFPVGVRTLDAVDTARGRAFSCEIWYPASARQAGGDLAAETQDSFIHPLFKVTHRQTALRDAESEPGIYPLIIFSHPSLSHRRSATFLCPHLSSHGYVVAALDHSEVIAKELGPQRDETLEQRNARWQAVIDSRVPDVRFLLDQVLCTTLSSGLQVDAARIGIAGHSLGGWTALAMPEVEPRIRSIVALAPGGASNPRPGILPATLTFAWNGDIPVLFLVAEDDVFLPLSGMYELFARTPASKQMVVLRRADHAHFMDNVEELHEWGRTMPAGPEMATMQKEMRPISELCSGEQAHLFTRGLALCHFDSTLKGYAAAQRFLAGDVQSELRKRGVDCVVHSASAI